jgi:hypothetical protein
VRRLAISLWAAQMLAAVVLLFAGFSDVESIIVTGPALSIIGLALAAVTRRLNSWESIAFGLSGPMICAFGATLIVVNRWGPSAAQQPICALAAIYAIAVTPLAGLALRAIVRWQTLTLPMQERVWQFSLKTLLVWMTAVCIAAAVGEYYFRIVADSPVGSYRDGWGFVLFALVAMALSAVILWRFVAKRQQIR